MNIEIGGRGFEWNGKTTRRLCSPVSGIAVMRVIRNKEVYDLCEVHALIPGGPYFYGLQKIFGTPYNRNILASRFAIGDCLEIDLPDLHTADTYWEQMAWKPPCLCCN